MSNLYLKRCSRWLLLYSLSIIAQKAGAQYSILSIDPVLKENADAVFQKDELKFEIINENKTRLLRHTVITIFNQNARYLGMEAVNYSNDSKIKFFEARLYDRNGKKVEELKKSDFLDRSSISGFSLYEDDMVRIADFRQKTYPYTVEFKYELEFNHTFYTPDWYVLSDEKIGVENSTFSMTAPQNLMPNYFLVNIAEPVVHNEGDQQTLTWVNEKVKPFEFEPYNTNLEYYSPIIYTSPGRFSYDGYDGDFSSWKTFGNWIADLNNNRDVLKESTINEIKALTVSIPSNKEKIRAVYSYLQSKTRYVSIQLGIGGYQPFAASVVEEYGYGDCKALTNYAGALLKALDIDAYYTLIRAGRNEDDIHPEFPVSQFNHVILMVPDKMDTIWLECTSQTNPFNYLGTFTGDRNALVVDRDNSKIIRTPAYPLEDNLQYRNATVELRNDGNATAKIKTEYCGLQFENGGINWVSDQSIDEQRKWLYKNLDLSSFNIQDFEIHKGNSPLPAIQVQLVTDLQKLGASGGKRLFFKPNLMNKQSHVPSSVTERHTPVILKRPFRDIDTIRYVLPDEYQIEFIPKPVNIRSDFGSYSTEYAKQADQVIYIRKMEFYGGKFEPEKYQSFIDFLKQVARADNEKIVLVKK